MLSLLVLASAQYPAQQYQQVQYQPQAVQYQQQPKYQQQQYQPQQTLESLPTPAQYPAGVDAQSCPNYPDCANPLVTLSAVAKASDPRYLVIINVVQVKVVLNQSLFRPQTPPPPHQDLKASTHRTFNRNWTAVNTLVTVIITVKVWMKRKPLK